MYLKSVVILGHVIMLSMTLFGIDWNYPEAGVEIAVTPSFTLERVPGKREALKLVPCPEGHPETRMAFMSARGGRYAAQRCDLPARNGYAHRIRRRGTRDN